MKTNCILLLLFLGCTAMLSAQKAIIQGTVYDPEGIEIPMANIKLIEQNRYIQSDVMGVYSFDALSEGTYTLQFSALGYADTSLTVELKADETKTLDLKMAYVSVEEVVVVGYGTSLKRDLTGSVSSLKDEDLKDALSSSFDQAIQGKAAGVQITTGGGVAGGGTTKIQIRGTNSIAAGSNPLIVVDGVPISNQDVNADALGNGANGLADLNMDDIASIDILKDASAAAIYGARGANGVILITTKKGKEGKTKFSFNYKSGIVNETNRLDLLSAEEHLALRDRWSIDRTGSPESKSSVIGIFEGRTYTRAQADSFAMKGGSDWISAALKTGFFHEGNLSASGGTEKTQIYFSGAFRDEESFLKGNSFQRIAARLNVINQSHDFISLGANTGITYSVNDRVPTGDGGGLGWAQQIPRYIPIYKEDGSYFNPASNPLWYLDNRDFVAKRLRSLSNIYAELKLHKTLNFRSSYGLDYTNLQEDEYQAANPSANSDAFAWKRGSNILNYSWSNYFSYSNNLGKDHNLNAVLGTDYQRTMINGMGIFGSGFSNAGFTNPQQASNQSLYAYQTGNAILSFYARSTYKLKNKYVLNLTGRVDGSSRFSEQKRFGFFPSVALGWIISDEKFMQKLSFMNLLKLRASYGLTGNDNIGDFTRLGLYSTGIGYQGGTAIFPSTLENTSLGWEKAQMLDISLEFGFLEDRISGSLTYFFKQSSDLLLPVQLPTSSGFSSMTLNAGVVNNSGLEFMVNSYNISTKDFKWKSNLNLSFIKNKVIDVAGLPPDAFESGQPGEGRVIEGYPVGQSFVVRYAGVAQENMEITRYNADGTIMTQNGSTVTATVLAGEALYYDKFGNIMAFGVDNNGTTNNSSDDINRFTGSDFYDNRVPVGKPNPDFLLGLTNTLSYKNFELSFLVNMVWGHTVYDDPAKNQIGMLFNVAQRPEILDAYNVDNPSADVPSLGLTTTPVNSDRFLYDASFIRLRSLSLAYNFPKKICQKMRLSNLRVYCTGFNLLTWTRYPGWDPEVLRHVPQNSQQENISFSGPSWQTPQARMIMFGLKTDF